ncbi:MAG TPA: hypothetical protein VFG50_10775 [Rhodothermales bacterium]|nr:hypothetical protein [Rhodothermales bacterium]
MKERWGGILETDRGKRVVNVARVLAVIGIVSYLVVRLSEVGWSNLWASRPHSLLYFLILPLLYFTLPVAEAIIYHGLWRAKVRRIILASLKKRTLNADVLNYSGEVHFYLWAKKNVALAPGVIFKNIKDNLIISSIASVSSAVLLLGAFMLSGQVSGLHVLGNATLWRIVLGIVMVVLVAGAVLKFRKSLFSLPGRTLGRLMAVHSSRFLVGWCLLIVQWWSVLPDVPFRAWAMLLTAIVLVDRIPLLPSKDLLQAGVGMQLAGMMHVPVATIAGLLLVRTVFDKSLNLSLYAGSFLASRRKRDGADTDAHPQAADIDAANPALARAA